MIWAKLLITFLGIVYLAAGLHIIWSSYKKLKKDHQNKKEEKS